MDNGSPGVAFRRVPYHRDDARRSHSHRRDPRYDGVDDARRNRILPGVLHAGGDDLQDVRDLRVPPHIRVRILRRHPGGCRLLRLSLTDSPAFPLPPGVGAFLLYPAYYSSFSEQLRSQSNSSDVSLTVKMASVSRRQCLGASGLMQ
jgi:hypothetical protein